MNAPDAESEVPSAMSSGSSSMLPADPETRPRRRAAWPLSGLLAGAFGLAVAELFVGVFDSFTSPVLSVGDKAIDLVPVPVKDFAIRTFGTKSTSYSAPR